MSARMSALMAHMVFGTVLASEDMNHQGDKADDDQYTHDKFDDDRNQQFQIIHLTNLLYSA